VSQVSALLAFEVAIHTPILQVLAFSYPWIRVTGIITAGGVSNIFRYPPGATFAGILGCGLSALAVNMCLIPRLVIKGCNFLTPVKKGMKYSCHRE
jgi:hypothetical protein